MEWIKAEVCPFHSHPVYKCQFLVMLTICILSKLAAYHAMEAPKSTASNSLKQASCPRSRLGLDSEDEEDKETDLETEYTLYISEKRASSTKDVLAYWQVKYTEVLRWEFVA
jgi:hypothetical protein